MGADFVKNNAVDGFAKNRQNVRGLITYAGSAANTFVPFLLGLGSTSVSYVNVPRPSPMDVYNWETGYFFQDDWKVNPRVTLNLGLRYDFDTNLRSNDFIAQLVADPAFAGLSNLVKSPRGNDYSHLQPRLGLLERDRQRRLRHQLDRLAGFHPRDLVGLVVVHVAGGNQPVQPRDFFQHTPPSTTPSTSNAISSQPKRTARFALSRKNASVSVTHSLAPPSTRSTASPRQTWESENVSPSTVMPSHASTSRSASSASRSGSGRPVSHQPSARRWAGVRSSSSRPPRASAPERARG